MNIYQISVSSINECYEGMDRNYDLSIETPSIEEATTIVTYFNDEDGNSWSCERNIYTLMNKIEQPLDQHYKWDEVSQYNTEY